MATVQSLVFFAFAIINLSSQMIIVAKPSSPRRLVMNLIHRDSPHSPYYRKNENFTTRAQHAMAISGLFADLYPFSGLFLVNFSIGQPPFPQVALMDTGSSLLWVQCSNQYPLMFNPQKSSTFTRLPCTSEYCIYPQPPNTSCISSHPHPCKYNITYADNEYSTGILAKEQLRFHTFDEGFVAAEDVIFGCADVHGNIEEDDLLIRGIFGLGFGESSLVTRFSKFSYCIGNALDPNYRYSQLVLGTDASTEGDSTPLQVITGHYYVVLEGISVGETSLLIDPNSFKWNAEEKRGVIMDSGSFATYLIEEGYDPLVETIHSLLDPWFTQVHVQDQGGYDLLCYRGNINQDLEGFPTVTFHFHGGADLALDTQSLFFELDSRRFCLAVLPSYANANLGNLSIIGVLAQQNYNVAYDIFGNSMFLQRIECELLLD